MPRHFQTSRQAREADFLPVLRELARAYQAFVSYDATGLREHGLTTSQADVLFTLGNTEGMTFKALGERTLITKGTLTGVVDRLEAKGLVRREAYPGDRRCTIAVLTAAGTRRFEQVFPRHLGYLAERFAGASARELEEARTVLAALRQRFES
jgi:DNA-binding MarR family transcriptional regulator